MSKTARLNRLFGTDGKCFDVAIDHGFFNELSFLNGIENIAAAIDTVVEACPDAVQLSPGQAHFLQRIPGKSKPALVMRTDVANVYWRQLPRYLFSQRMEQAVEQAVRLDAACVVVNLLLVPEQPELYHQCMDNIAHLAVDCEKYGMPLMVEPLVMQPNDLAGGYMVDGDIHKILPLVRQAVELGADIIKADPCDAVDQYHRVVEAASGRPILVRGGGKASDEEILDRTHRLMIQGASGIVYGRNVVQHKSPNGMTSALMAIVHSDATPEQAIMILHESMEV